MAIAKIIEVVSEGSTIEEAVENIVKDASKTIRNIKGIDVMHFHAMVENNKVVKYRVNAKVAFAIE